MTIRILGATFAMALALAATARTGYAQDRPKLPVEVVPAPAVAPDPAPVVTIAKPANLAVIGTHRTAMNDQKWGRLECLLDPADREIRIDAKSWKLSPKGNGITVVVDDFYSTTVHDLSKPIRLDTFVPYNSGWPQVLSKCGWHTIVAFATDANGVSVPGKTSVAVSYYFAASEQAASQSHRPDDSDVASYRNQPALVLNPAPWHGSYVDNGGSEGNPPSWKVGGGPITFDLVYGTPVDAPAPSDCSVQFRASGPDPYYSGGELVQDFPGWASPRGQLRTGPIDPKVQKDGRMRVQASVRCQQPKFTNYPAPPVELRFGSTRPYATTGSWPVFTGKNKARDDFFEVNRKSTNERIHRARVKNGDDPPDPSVR